MQPGREETVNAELGKCYVYLVKLVLVSVWSLFYCLITVLMNKGALRVSQNLHDIP